MLAGLRGVGWEIKFCWTPREQNEQCDALSKKIGHMPDSTPSLQALASTLQRIQLGHKAMARYSCQDVLHHQVCLSDGSRASAAYAQAIRSVVNAVLVAARFHNPDAAGNRTILRALERDAHRIMRARMALIEPQPADIHVVVLVQRSGEGDPTDFLAIFEKLDRPDVSPLLAIVAPHLHLNSAGTRKERRGLPGKLTRRVARQVRGLPRAQLLARCRDIEVFDVE